MKRGSVCWASAAETRTGLEGEGDSGSQGRGGDSTEGVVDGEAVAWGGGFEGLGWLQLEVVMVLSHLEYLYLKALSVCKGGWWLCACRCAEQEFKLKL